jgi:diaminopimelate epimerase
MERPVRVVPATLHEGCGNDFIVVVDLDGELNPTVDDIVRSCSREGQHGADGFIAIRNSSVADLEMTLWNADGSMAEMSGNGIRCFAQAASLAGLLSGPAVTVETGAGVRTVSYAASEQPERGSASVTMGPVSILDDEVSGDGDELVGVRLARRASVGNPHLVVVVDDATRIDPLDNGPGLSTAPAGGTNVEWISVRGANELDFVVYERGVGPTKACGTGSCAAAVVACAEGLVTSPVLVHNPGGTLRVACENLADVVLSGPVSLLGDLTVTVGLFA